MVQRSSAAARLTDIVSIRSRSVLLNASCLALRIRIGDRRQDSIARSRTPAVGECLRQLVDKKMWRATAIGAPEDGQLFSRLQLSGRRVDIASKRLCCWFSRFDVTYCGRIRSEFASLASLSNFSDAGRFWASSEVCVAYLISFAKAKHRSQHLGLLRISSACSRKVIEPMEECFSSCATLYVARARSTISPPTQGVAT